MNPEHWLLAAVKTKGFTWPLVTEECAEVLKICRRSLQDVLKHHPHYHSKGNKKLFSPTDVQQIWEAMKCSENSKEGKSITYAGPSKESTFMKALAVAEGRMPRTALFDAKRKSGKVVLITK